MNILTYQSNDPERELIDMIANVRIYKKITQENMSKLLSTHKSNISRFETNIHSPTLNTIFNYVEALGCKLEITVKDLNDE